MAFSTEDFRNLGRTLEDSMTRGVKEAVEQAINTTTDSQQQLSEATSKLQDSQVELIKAVEALSGLNLTNISGRAQSLSLIHI